MPQPVSQNLRDDPIAKEEDPLLRYSTIWYRHINEADELDTKLPDSKTLASKARSLGAQLDRELLRTKAHRLFCDEFSQSFRNWCHLIRYPTSRFMEADIQASLAFNLTHTTPIVMASLLNMVDNVRRLLSEGVNVDGDVKSDVMGITKPVQVAAIAGSLKVLRLLLDRRAILTQSDLNVVAHNNARHGASVLITILQSRQDLAITDDTLTASASNFYSSEMLDYLLGTKDFVTLTHSTFMSLVQSPWTSHGEIGLVEKILSRFWFMIRTSDNILITKQVMRPLATNTTYGHIIFGLLMNHGNCKDNDFEGLTDHQIVPGVEKHLRTCSVEISKARMRACLRWKLGAIAYLENHARPNVKFAEDDPKPEPFNFKAIFFSRTSAAKPCWNNDLDGLFAYAATL